MKCPTCGRDWSRCNHTWSGNLPEDERLDWTPTLYDGIVTAWVDDDEGESYWMARWDTKGLLRWMTGTGDTREQAVKVLVEMAPSVMMALHGWMDEETQKRHRLEQQLHRDPEPPDSTEPEDKAHPLPWHVGDVVKAGGHLCTVTKVDAPDHLIPSYTIRPHSTALHDTGILTTESETP